MKHATEPIPSLRQKVPTLSPEVEQVVLKALAKDQKERFPHIQDFVQALEQAAQPAGSTTMVRAETEQQQTVIEQAEQLLQGGRNRAAGAIAGVILEAHLKKLCDTHKIPYPDRKGLQALIQVLQHKSVISREEARHLTHLASIRNKCDHASPVSEQEVRLLVEEVKKIVDRVDRAKDGGHPASNLIAQEAVKPVRDSNGGRAEVLQPFQADKANMLGASPVKTAHPREIIYPDKATVLAQPASSPGVATPLKLNNTPQFIYLAHTTEGLCPGMRGVAWSPDGKYIASSEGNLTAHIWNAHTGKILSKVGGRGEISWSPDSRFVAIYEDDDVSIADAYQGVQIGKYEKHEDGINAVVWSPDGKYIASGGKDKLVQVWEARTGKSLCTYTRHTSEIEGIAWSPDGKYIMSGSRDTTAQIWEARAAKHLFSYRAKNSGSSVTSVAWSRNSQYIAFGIYGLLQVWEAPPPLFSNTREGKLLFSADIGSAVESLTWSPDSKYIVTCDEDREHLEIWEVLTGKLLCQHTFPSEILNPEKRSGLGTKLSMTWPSSGLCIATAQFGVHVWQA